MKGFVGVIISVTSMAIGAGVSYFVTARAFNKKVTEIEKDHSDTIFELDAVKSELHNLKECDRILDELNHEDEPEETPIKHTPAFQTIEPETNDISVIAFDDFETIPEYDSEVLFFYPDTGDVLDDQHQPVGKSKLKTMIPDDFVSYFDTYDEDPDCVRVQNDILKTYYEILRYYTSP